MLAAAQLGRRRGLLSNEGEEAIKAAVSTLGPLPSLAEIDAQDVGPHIGHDKKKTDDGIGWVLPTDNGVALGQKVVAEEALEVLEELKRTTKFGD